MTLTDALKPAPFPNAALRLVRRIERDTLSLPAIERRETLCAIHEYLAQRIVSADVADRANAQRARAAARKPALVQLGKASTVDRRPLSVADRGVSGRITDNE